MYSKLVTFIRDWYQTKDPIPLHEPRFKDIDRKYVLDAIDSTYVSSVGAYVDRFEQDLAAYLGAGYAVVTVNGTAALQVALKLAGVRAEDEVITQPLTFVATANAIAHNNAVPVFVDVNRETLGLCPDAFEQFLHQNARKTLTGTVNKNSGRPVRAVVPMHTFGHPCKMQQILDLAEEWHLAVVEDAAEALGSSIALNSENGAANKSCATFGKLGILSFNGNKTITCGGGGAIITDDKKLAARAKHLTTTAKVKHPRHLVHDDIGYNYRMPNLNAALACSQLAQVDGFLTDKRKLAEAYDAFFAQCPWAEFVREPDGCTSNYWLNTVITADEKQRDDLLVQTNQAGIMTRLCWHLIPDLPMYKDCQKGELKTARRLAERIVNLPSSARANA